MAGPSVNGGGAKDFGEPRAGIDSPREDRSFEQPTMLRAPPKKTPRKYGSCDPLSQKLAHFRVREPATVDYVLALARTTKRPEEGRRAGTFNRRHLRRLLEA